MPRPASFSPAIDGSESFRYCRINDKSSTIYRQNVFKPSTQGCQTDKDPRRFWRCPAMNVRSTAATDPASGADLGEELSQLEMSLTVLWNSARRWLSKRSSVNG